MTVEEELRRFRDEFKDYGRVFEQIWSALNEDCAPDPGLLLSEERLREELTETLGRLCPILRKIPGTFFQSHIAATNQTINVFEEALSRDPYNPHKGDSIDFAIQAITKAIGATSRFSEERLQAFMRPACRAFFSYSFRPDNNDLVDLTTDQLRCLQFEVVKGDDARPTSVSQKVKDKIDSCDVVVVLMTKDLETTQGWSASSWVNQEATYALGRRIQVIRLIEQGVATDGKIFGDQEYIIFDRSNPAKAIVNLGRMLRFVGDGNREQ